jgi:hypothetical protein
LRIALIGALLLSICGLLTCTCDCGCSEADEPDFDRFTALAASSSDMALLLHRILTLPTDMPFADVEVRLGAIE